MTVIMTLIGVVVFFIRLATAGFKAAFGSLLRFALVGFVIDLSIVGLVVLAYHLNS